MIKVLADQNLYKIKQFIPPQAELHTYDPEQGISNLDGFDALLVRTVTSINKDSLKDIPPSLSFIGTGSSGSDHLDTDYLRDHEIEVADAKGCNARAVAEYVITALMLWKHDRDLNEIPRTGIIGVGKVGTAVHQILKVFGVETVLYDPPREQRDEHFTSASLEEVLDCPVLSFHVPLKKAGDHETFHWLDAEKLKDRAFSMVINAARGGVVNEMELMKAYVENRVQDYILDVWENEPDFNPEIAKHAYIATPHIAGYSEQAKLNASKIICEKMARHFQLPAYTSEYKSIPQDKDLAHIDFDMKTLLTRLHPILEYDKALRDLSHREDKEKLFRSLRTDWPFRFEYPMMRIREELLQEFDVLQKLGIRTF